MSKRRYVKYEQLKHNRAKESAAQFWGLFPFPSVTLIPVEPPFPPARPEHLFHAGGPLVYRESHGALCPGADLGEDQEPQEERH